jgi:transcriptional regulator with XRE-family HTH domain
MSARRVLMLEAYRCDVAHPSRVNYPDFRASSGACDTAQVAEAFDIEALRAQLDRLMRQHNDGKGIGRKPLAKAAGLGETAIRDIMEGGRDVRMSTLVKLAEFFDTTVDELARPVELGGKIGAGGSILFGDPDETKTVERPPLALGRMMALQVVGDSMFPRYDEGAVVYIRRDHEGVLPDYLGKECAVHLVDGGTFLKVLEEGTEPGKYNLRSHNAPLMRNVEVVWASPVLFVRPHWRSPAS